MKRVLFFQIPPGQEPMYEDHRGYDYPFPPSYLVVRFARHFDLKCLIWFINKIRGKRKNGGAELLVRRQPLTDSLTKGVTIHLSASTSKVLEVAEELEMRKQDNTGLLREFVLTQTDCFLPEGLTVEDLFTTAEKQTIVKHELENIRAVTKDDYLPGYPMIKLYPGQSIFQVLVRYGFIERCYPLHDPDALKKLGHKWYLTLYKNQPYEDIRLYFGENVALYFIFLGYYTTALIPPMVLGLLELLIPQTTTVFFCVFNVLWVTLFLELWKRKSSELAYQWGTIGMTSLDEPRPEFRGKMGVDEVTGRYQPKYPRWKTNVKMYCVSLPIVILCLVFAFCIMLISFMCETLVIENRKAAGDDSLTGRIIIALPSITYAGLVYVMNLYYKKLATFLTDWENHRTQSQFDRHRVTKLVLFEFINNFMSMFYIAFVIQDMEMLKSQLATMLIILQGFNNIQEALLPLFIRCYGKKISKFFKSQRFFKSSSSSCTYDNNDSFSKEVGKMLQDVLILEEDDPRIEQAISEARLETYEGTYDDYLEMFVQFGYVFLFSSVYPMAAFWAVANNVLEIRGDAFKLCKLCQRTMPRKVKDIGAWQRAFEWVGAMSIMTNCGLMCISPQLRSLAPEMGAVEWILIFVFVEHVLLVIRQLLHDAISEKPEWVRIALAKINYQSKQALKNERILKNRAHLSQKLKL
ncbi:UNVERIFIED_CONTAM: hypothetical protein PYX00_006638 [Menopon gallinae]|uniref:Anoctamin n=1 Tax=Menopon gallinae TaxID=328185 RepID=A0AAW2HW28_9NEOP